MQVGMQVRKICIQVGMQVGRYAQISFLRDWLLLTTQRLRLSKYIEGCINKEHQLIVEAYVCTYSFKPQFQRHDPKCGKSCSATIIPNLCFDLPKVGYNSFKGYFLHKIKENKGNVVDDLLDFQTAQNQNGTN